MVNLREILDRERIRELIYTYCRAADRGDLDLLRSIAWPEAQFEYGIFSGKRDAFIDFVGSFVSTIGATHHNVTNILIQTAGDCAQSESYCIAVHGDVTHNDQVVDLVVYVRYLDRFECRDGEWRLSSRLLVYDWNQNLPRTAHWEGELHGSYLPRGRRDGDDQSQRPSNFI